jgi:8-amino-7-oxononanoate synthase
LFSALPEQDDHVFADRHIHHSVIAGLLRSKAKFHRFPHLDLDRLEECLRKRQGAAGNDFVVTESVFSMDGDCPDLTQLAELRARYGFAWIVDEAHALGWYGERGSGLLEQRGILEQADAVLGTFGKALGSQGAYLLLRREAWRRYLMNFAGEFIYSTYLAPSAAAAAAAAIDLTCRLSQERPLWREGSKQFRRKLRQGGWDVPNGDSPVVPLMLGEVETAMELAERLRAGGVLAGMVRPPTVPQGTSRLRFSLKTNLSLETIADQINQLLGGAEP